jgi:NADH-quinone oxidoreductase subunit C
MDSREKLRDFLQSRFKEAIVREDDFRGEQSFYIRPEALIDICQGLLDNDELAINYLADLTSVDWLGMEEQMGGRFEVVYNLYSLSTHYRFFLKAILPAENPEIASLTPLFGGANWMEREVWDLMGIVFTGHPELTKILTPDELEGYPLRRDYPLTYEVPRFTWNKDNPPEVIK